MTRSTDSFLIYFPGPSQPPSSLPSALSLYISLTRITKEQQSDLMEKRSTRMKRTFLKLLPKAASPAIFLSPPLSPVGDRRIENTTKLKAITKGYSGPNVSMVPPEARRKSKNGSFDTREPTSPKVSCMGQINSKKKKNKSKTVLPPTEKPKPVSSPGKSKKNPFEIHRIFQGSNHCRKSGHIDVKQPAPDRTPSLSQMKGFASGRDAFMNFDWRVHGAAVAPDNQNHCADGKEEGEEKAIISFSAPIAVGGAVAVGPKKAIDLWKRRTVPPPPALQL